MPQNMMEVHRPIRPVMAGLCLLFVVAVYAHPVCAAELRASGSASAVGSSWRGDVVGYGGVEVGARFLGFVGPYAGGALGIGTVDDRMLTAISVGAQLWGPWQPVRPYLRVGAVHQHEESLSVVAGDIGSAVLGIGEGIRHRGGAELGLGAELPIERFGDTQFLVGAKCTARIFPDELGPQFYAGGGLTVSLVHSL